MTYGITVGCLWNAYGIPMGYLWDAYGMHMGCPWDTRFTIWGDYKSLIAVNGEIFFLLWSCGLGPMGNLWDHAAAMWHLWETISP